MTCPITLNHPELEASIRADEPPEIVADWLLDQGCTFADVLGLYLGGPWMQGDDVLEEFGTHRGLPKKILDVWVHQQYPGHPAIAMSWKEGSPPDLGVNVTSPTMGIYLEKWFGLQMFAYARVWVGPYRSRSLPQERVHRAQIDPDGPVASSNLRIESHHFAIDIDKGEPGMASTFKTVNVKDAPTRRGWDLRTREYLLWVQRLARHALPSQPLSIDPGSLATALPVEVEPAETITLGSRVDFDDHGRAVLARGSGVGTVLPGGTAGSVRVIMDVRG